MTRATPRIDLLAPPFSGHLHPILGIAAELAPAFHVSVLSTPTARAAVEASGIEFRPLLTDEHDAQLRALANPPRAVGGNPLRLRAQFRSAVALLTAFGEELALLYRDDCPALVVADFTLPTAGIVAQSLALPWWTSVPSPCVIETADGPPAYWGGLTPATNAAVHAAHALARRTVRGFKRAVCWLHRRELAPLGVTSPYRADGSEASYSPSCVLALGVPELEFARTWPGATRFVGPVLHDPPLKHAAPPFVEGARHVLVTLGTHLKFAKDAWAARVERAARTLPGVQFHFSDGVAAGARQRSTANFTRLDYVDYGRCLDRYDLVVHHGGAGVMYHCLRAAKPAIVIPHDYDQFDHAARLELRDAAVWLRDPERLSSAVQSLLTDPDRLAGLPALSSSVRAAIAARDLIALARATLR